MNKKGFTLVELLAVIVILAIILAIAVPSITGILNSAKRSSFEADVKLIIKGIEYKMLERDAGTEVPTDVIPENAPTEGAPFYMTENGLTAYGANADNYVVSGAGEACIITSLNPVTVTVISESTSEFGAYTATGTRNTLTVTP